MLVMSTAATAQAPICRVGKNIRLIWLCGGDELEKCIAGEEFFAVLLEKVATFCSEMLGIL